MIDTAPVFEPLLQPARYKGAYGGRGSAKSHFFAELLVEACLIHPGMRAVCIREVQKTLKESAKRLIEDKIRALGLAGEFRPYEDRIATPGGGLVTFMGMVDQTADSIKSLEGYRVAWIEEAQSLSQRSLDMLRPTIRLEGSEIWASWNPRYRTDPIDFFLRQSAPDGAAVVRSNYKDNPWFPDVLEDERRHDERTMTPEKYANIWEGAYEELGDRQFIGHSIVEAAMRAEAASSPQDELILGVDVARYGDDETVIAVRRGRDARSHSWHRLRGLDTMEVASRVAALMDDLGPDAVFVDETGVGAGVVDRLRQLGRRIMAVNFGSKAGGSTGVKTANKRAEMWQRMKEWLSQGAVAIPNDRKLEAELTSVQYSHDVNNAILLEKKDDMRKRGLPSPDMADALALTFAFPVSKRTVAPVKRRVTRGMV